MITQKEAILCCRGIPGHSSLLELSLLTVQTAMNRRSYAGLIWRLDYAGVLALSAINSRQSTKEEITGAYPCGRDNVTTRKKEPYCCFGLVLTFDLCRDHTSV